MANSCVAMNNKPQTYQESFMPADVGAVMTRKHRARTGMHNDISVLSICFIATLTVIMLLFASDEFAAAMALLGQY
jgi:hypothetical protein